MISCIKKFRRLLFQLRNRRAVSALIRRRKSEFGDVRMTFEEMMDEIFQRARTETVNNADARQGSDIGII
jgi:hypothetical protein